MDTRRTVSLSKPYLWAVVGPDGSILLGRDGVVWAPLVFTSRQQARDHSWRWERIVVSQKSSLLKKVQIGSVRKIEVARALG